MVEASPTLGHQRELRLAAGGVVAIAAAWPVLPFHPSVACPFRLPFQRPCSTQNASTGVTCLLSMMKS